MRSGTIVLFANIVDVAAVLARNILLARLLPVEQFGLAATFSILMTMVETFQNVGLNRLVVQSQHADDPGFVAALHGAQIVVSLLAAAALALAAAPFAMLMHTPGVAAAYRLLAIVPLINAFANLETFRVQRDGRFGPQVMRSLLSQPIGLLAVLPGFWWFGDYRAALVAVIVQQATATLLTHVRAGAQYHVAFDRATCCQVVAFGWPLIANGLLIFLILNGDRMVVLNRFGATALGWFSAAVMLTLTPANLIAKSLQTIILPLLARAQADPGAFRKVYGTSLDAVALAAVALAVGTLLVGEFVLTTLFGPKFLPGAAFLTALACMNAIRLFRAVPAIAGMARGNTRDPLYANIVRVLGVPASLAVALATGAVAPMIVTGIVTELASAIVAIMLARRHLGGSPTSWQTPLLAGACLTLAVAIDWFDIRLWLALLPLAALVITQSATTLVLARNLPLDRSRPKARARSPSL